MKTKIVTITLLVQLCFAITPVTDTKAYYYLISSVQQTVQLINSATEQIETLGGIRTAVEDMKDDINNAKSSLEGSMKALKNAQKRFKKSLGSVEMKSLFDLNAERTTTSGTGIGYKKIKEVFSKSFDIADKAFIKSIGGETKINNFFENQYKLNKALKMNSIDDFQKVMNSTVTKSQIKEEKRKMLIRNFIKDSKNLDFKSRQNTAAQAINNEWKGYFFPETEKELEAQEERENRIEELATFISKSQDMRQSIKTTNMILFELLKLMQKEYNSALNYRNAMTVMYLKNGTNSALASELNNRIKELKKIKDESSLPKSLKEPIVNKLKGANPYGIGWSIADNIK